MKNVPVVVVARYSSHPVLVLQLPSQCPPPPPSPRCGGGGGANTNSGADSDGDGDGDDTRGDSPARGARRPAQAVVSN